MKKSQESHKVRRKKTSRQESPWNLQSTKDAPTRLAKDLPPEVSVEAEELEVMLGELDDIGRALQGFSNTKEFFEYEKPIIEIHIEPEITTLSTTKIMKAANRSAGIFFANKEMQEEFVPEFRHHNFSKYEMKIDDLDRIIVVPRDSGTFSFVFVFLEGTDAQCAIAWSLKMEEFCQNHSERFIELIIAGCMFIEGEIHPENSVQERTFVLDGTTVTINKNMFMNIKEHVKLQGDMFGEPDMADDIFANIVAICGGKVTHAKLDELDDENRAVLNISVAFALAHGFKQWPEEPSD